VARACQFIARTVTGQYQGLDFPVLMPGWLSAGNGVANDLKVKGKDEKRQFL